MKRRTLTIGGIVARAKKLEAAGIHAMWMANIFGLDAITTCAIVGHETERIENDGFTRTSFTGQGRESRCRLKIEAIDQDK